MLLGNDAAAAQLLGRATSAAGSIPKSFSSLYQLGIVTVTSRMEDAQKAMATFQKLKDEARRTRKKR